METQTKNLIAVGAAVATNCQPCLQKLVEVARGNGVDEQDIMTAVTVGSMVRKGAMDKMDAFAATMFEDLKACAGKVESPCGCG